jgi:hypothetical protein
METQLPSPLSKSLDSCSEMAEMEDRASRASLAMPVTISSGGRSESGMGLLSPVKILHDESIPEMRIPKSKPTGAYAAAISSNCGQILNRRSLLNDLSF